MKFSITVGNEPLNNWLNFGLDPDYRRDTGIVFRICHSWEIRKVLNGHSSIPIRQMAALVGCALAEVCNVSVLLVFFCFWFSASTLQRSINVSFV